MQENKLLNEISQVYEDLLSGVISIEVASQTECLVTVKEKIQKLKSTMKNQKTARLWLIYMEIKRVPKSRKTGRMGTTPRSTERHVALLGCIRSQFVYQICQVVSSEND